MLIPLEGGKQKNEGGAPRKESAADTAKPGSNDSGKTGRQRYLRLFPERATYLIATLTPAELTAYMAVLVHYVIKDGVVEDGDHLAHIVGMSGKRWRDLRNKLIALGVLHERDGFLRDPDQDVALAFQRDTSSHARRAATVRWERRRG